ncbi:ribose 5-phosphate isomerase B [Spiroplasma endosymbiont of Anurida maritima]|uniref:ribose 5-phosphate isomerase B n=1 Tax=Spiroplasma endosymbiont of Anurida maritima TaxID=2967972 RepID=UPI0036D3FF40
MKILFGNDHTAVELKTFLAENIKNHFNFEISDIGAQNNNSVDYSSFGKKVAKAVANNEYDFGIIICGSGIGISIAANRVKKARASLCYEPYTAKLAREHNNANILALGARITAKEHAWEIVKTFLSTKFEGGRHQERIDNLDK